jgi:hypothetical protein
MAVGKVIARRLIIASRASCILILRSNERDCALFDMLNRLGDYSLSGRDHSRGFRGLQKTTARRREYEEYWSFSV